MLLTVLMSACDGCEGCSDEPEQKDQGPVIEQDMAPPKAPDMRDPLAEAKEQADKDGAAVAIGRLDIANIVAANIEAATTEVDTKSTKTTSPRIKTSRHKGSIDPKAAAKVFRKFDGAMKMCYERALKKSPGLEGKVGLTVVVNSTGAVTSSNARGLSLRSSLVSDCMENLARRMKFPAPRGGDAQINKTYVFKPQL